MKIAGPWLDEAEVEQTAALVAELNAAAAEQRAAISRLKARIAAQDAALARLLVRLLYARERLARPGDGGALGERYRH